MDFFDAARDSRFMDDRHVRIGDNHNYGTKVSQPGEVYHITVKNGHDIGGHSPLEVACSVEGFRLENFYHSLSIAVITFRYTSVERTGAFVCNETVGSVRFYAGLLTAQTV